MFDQFSQHLIGQAFLIGPLGVAENAVQGIGIGLFNSPQGILNGLSHMFDAGAGFAPVRLIRNLKTVLFGQGGIFLIPVRFLQRGGKLLIIHITKALIEQQRENILLVVSGVDIAAQQGCRSPKVGFQSGL